jgi:hypothetical protein
MIITCPLTIGKNSTIKCTNGKFNNTTIRCPYYQKVGITTPINRLLDLKWMDIFELGRYYNELQDDFYNISQFTYTCTQYPEINEQTTQILLYGKDGKYHNIEDVMLYYTNNYHNKLNDIKIDHDNKNIIEHRNYQ